MKSVQSIRRFASKAWLVAGPLIILLLLISVPTALAIIGAIVERIFGPQAAERYSVFLLDATMWGAELTLLFAPIGLAIYVTVRLARWYVRKKEP
jgi:hypothetical protein